MVPELPPEQLACADKEVGMVEEVGFYHGLQVVVAFVGVIEQSSVVQMTEICAGEMNGRGVGVCDDNSGVIGFAEALKGVRKRKAAAGIVEKEDGVFFQQRLDELGRELPVLEVGEFNVEKLDGFTTDLRGDDGGNGGAGELVG